MSAREGCVPPCTISDKIYGKSKLKVLSRGKSHFFTLEIKEGVDT